MNAGWGDAAHYHFYNWDSSFLDYTKEGGGHITDRERMVEYQNIQPDLFRYKKYDNVKKHIPLPSLNFPFSENYIQNLSLEERIKYLLALAFGKHGEKPCHWSEVPLLRRTSPSGGSRHPTEGYFLTSHLKNIEHGFYHIQTDPNSLCLISNENCLLEEFIEESNTNCQTLGAIILTSIFEKNMYRYRESRTFRTIHMDIGHIMATIEMLGNEFRIKTKVYLNFNENIILNKIQASMLEEGIMAVITLQEEA